MESVRKRKAGLSTLCLLIVIAAAGAGLRFHRISEVEPFLADEAIYYLEARYLYSLFETAWDSLQRQVEERRSGEDLWRKEEEGRRFKEDLEGRAPWFARPGHLYLLCLAMAILGPDKVYVGPVVSAVSGTLCIPLVFLLGRRLYGSRAGLLAAALFSFSGVQVLYARSGLTEQPALAFFLPAVLFYVKNRQAERDRRGFFLILSGLFLGLSFVVHYRMIIFIVGVFLLELPFWLGRGRSPLRVALQRMAVLAGFAVLPLFLTELPYYLGMLFVHFFFQATLPFQTYFEQLFGQAVYLVLTYLHSPNTGVRLVNFLTYPFLLWKVEGPALAVGLLLAWLMLVRLRRAEDTVPTVLFFVPLILCTLFNPRTRYLSGFLPFANLLIAACLERMRAPATARRARWRRVAFPSAVALLLVFGVLYSMKAMRSKASYGRAMAFVEEQGGLKHLASIPVLTQVYVGVKNVPDEWPSNEEELRELYDRGHRYFIMDFFKDVIDVVIQEFRLDTETERYLAFQRRIDLMNRIEERTSPVFECPNKHTDEISNIFEVNQDFPQTMMYYRKMQEHEKARTIRVYDLKDYFEP